MTTRNLTDENSKGTVYGNAKVLVYAARSERLGLSRAREHFASSGRWGGCDNTRTYR
jgi:hypothetical protein